MSGECPDCGNTMCLCCEDTIDTSEYVMVHRNEYNRLAKQAMQLLELEMSEEAAQQYALKCKQQLAKQAEQLKEAEAELKSWNDNYHEMFNVDGELTTTTDDYFERYKGKE